jgi:ABC-2 type transport system ATP-binding protein
MQPSNHQNQQIIKEPLLEVSRVTKKFGDLTAVDQVNFEVPPGGIFGLIGPSGAGKTTLIRLLTGVYQPDQGELDVLGTSPIDFQAEDKENIGYMPQHFVLYPRLTVQENLDFVAAMYGMGLDRRQRIQEVLEFVELTPHRDKLSRNLSGGMQRRLSLSAALVHSPALIFLDEPSAGIDPVLRSEIWEGLFQLRDEGRTLFVTTQYVSEAANCDLVAVLSEGSVITVNTPAALRREAYGGEILQVELVEPLEGETFQELHEQDFICEEVITEGTSRLRLVVEDAKSSIPELMAWFDSRDLEVESIDVAHPPFDDVFVKLVSAEQDDQDG